MNPQLFCSSHYEIHNNFLILIGFSGTTFACLCDGLTVDQMINHADIVFPGTIKGNMWNHYDKNIVTGFEVQKIWKESDSFLLIEN